MTAVSLSAADISYGGKASGLARLISYGMPVPEGIAISPELVSLIVSNAHMASGNQIIKDFLSRSVTKRLAVRSSALNEDGPEQSFAGIYDTVLDVSPNVSDVTSAISKVYAGLESARANFYKANGPLRQHNVPHLGIVIQEMIDPAIAGVAFSSALALSGDKVILLECVEGLGDKLVSGEVIPSRIEIPLSGNNEPLLLRASARGKLSNFSGIDQVAYLVVSASQKAQTDLDIEWAVDKSGKAWMLQARPITRPVLSPATNQIFSVAASPGISKGCSFVIEDEADIDKFPAGAILVAQVTDTNYLPAMRRSAGVITEEGGTLSHAAIVSREMNIPCVVGYSGARALFPTGTEIVLDGTSGIVGSTSNSGSITQTAKRQDIDWGAAYLFENILPISVSGTTVLFDPSPNALAVHVPEEMPADIDDKLERLARSTFSVSPRRYSSDKYLWFFEWERFNLIPAFRDNVSTSKALAERMDPAAITDFYDGLINKGSELLKSKDTYTSDASRFLIEESLMSTHFLLTMVIPEGYALRSMYKNALPDMAETKISFGSLLSQHEDTENLPPSLSRVASFARVTSNLRNNVYTSLIANGIMRDDYFDDRAERATSALAAMGIATDADIDPVQVFYDNIEFVPDFSIITASLKSYGTQKKSTPVIIPNKLAYRPT